MFVDENTEGGGGNLSGSEPKSGDLKTNRKCKNISTEKKLHGQKVAAPYLTN